MFSTFETRPLGPSPLASQHLVDAPNNMEVQNEVR